MLPNTRNYVKTWTIAAHARGGVALMLTFGAVLLTPLPGHTWQKGQPKDSMPGMDMSGDEDMSKMGPSMAAMAGHMYMTPRRPMQPGDMEKAKAIVATLKASMERYKDYRKALADGYYIAKPELKQPQYHFINKANTREADLQFDPSKPTALLYRRTPMQEYKLEGAMYTARPDATEDESNQRVPLALRAGIGTSTSARPRKAVSTTTRASIPSSACSDQFTPPRPAKPQGEPSNPRYSPGYSTSSLTRPTSRKSFP